jgi:ParB-like chromosome segregation protein Spo0J
VVARITKKKPLTILRTEEVGINTISTFDKNPRRGNIDMIAESLKTWGQFKPIVVNLGTKLPKGKQNKIVAGNHTFLGAKRNKMDSIVVSFIDVDESTARAIVLADNKTSDGGTYDDALLAELLASLPDIEGTGYSETEAEDLIAALGNANDALDESLDDFVENFSGDKSHTRPSVSEVDFGEENEADFSRDENDADLEEDTKDVFKTAGNDLPGAFSLKAGMVFEGAGFFEIPKLRNDMLVDVEDLPEDLKSWAGSATKDWPDDEQWWLYNYGVDSTSGMKDPSKIILSFYCWDEYFEKWWDKPDVMTSKTLNTGITMAVTPNFSTWADEPGAVQLWACYKKAWMGRYFQEAGIKVIPNIEWPGQEDDTFLKQYAMLGIPVGAPVISIQGQTSDGTDDVAYQKWLKRDYKTIITALKPKMLLYYGTKKGYDFVLKQNLPVTIYFVENRMAALAIQAKGRKRKTTL